MQDKDDFNETEYIERFNLGYKVAKDFPEIAEFISGLKGNVETLDAVKSGIKQHQFDSLDVMSNKWLSKFAHNEPEKDKGKTIDKDGIEPEL